MDSLVYFESGSPVIRRLAEAITTAELQRKSVRFVTGRSRVPGANRDANWIKFKIGEGMWSEPIWEDTDPYRDNR